MVNPLWQVRAFVYSHFADTTHAPSVDETAQHFNINTEEAGEIYKELHNRHAFFLEPETLKSAWQTRSLGFRRISKSMRMGKPILPTAPGTCSASPPLCTVTRALKPSARKAMRQFNWKFGMERFSQGGTAKVGLVHFPLPFARWYDDLVFT